MNTGSARRPSPANTEYALAMSSGVTPLVPSTADGNGSRWVVTIPSRRASSTAAWGPTSIMSCAYTVFTDSTVASVRFMRPPSPLPS